MRCCTLIYWPNSLKTVPSGVANCRNLPFAGRATRGSRVRLPREEGTRSCHQRLFKENVRKTEMCGLRTLSVKGSGVVFTHEEGISTLRVHHKGRQPLIKCAISCLQLVLFSLFYVFMFFMGLLYFLSFCGRQGCFSRSYLSPIAMRKLDLLSSFRTKHWLSYFYLFSQDIF